jgi:RTX calcium-binding nonapeptide repeat (4 copies)
VEGTEVTVTDTASLAQLAAIADANGYGDLYYSAIADTAAALAANTIGYIVAGIDITVTDTASLAQLSAIDAANGGGDLAYTAISDKLEKLVVGSVPAAYVVPGVTVTVEDVTTIAPLVALDAANGDAVVHCVTITDTWQNLMADAAAPWRAEATTLKLLDYNLGQVTVAQVQVLLHQVNLKDASDGTLDVADLAFTLADTAGNLAGGTDEVAAILDRAGSVTATSAASVWQAEVIHARKALAAYDIADSGWSIANGSAAAVTKAVDLTATSPVSTEEATAIHARDGAAGDVHYDVTDSYDDLVAMDAAARTAATDIRVTGHNSWPYELTTAEAVSAIGFNNQGRTEIDAIRGTAAELNAFVNANPETAGDTGISYGFRVQDSASGILTAIGGGTPAELAFVTGKADPALVGDHRASEIFATTSFDTDGVETFWAHVAPIYSDAATTGARTRYSVQDDVADYTNTVAARDSVTKADQLYLSGTAAAVHAAQNGLDPAHADIFRLLDQRQNGGDAITVTASAGNQFIRASAGNDHLSLGDGHDYATAGAGNDYVVAGAGVDLVHGGDGKDTILGGSVSEATDYASAQYAGTTTLIGGRGGDLMQGSAEFDSFVYQGGTRADLIAESGTTRIARDYITDFALGDRILFQSVGADQVQFFGSGSANAAGVEAGTLGLSIRYEKNVEVLNWAGDGLVPATRVLIDVADANGRFDDVADMHIVLQGAGLDINWDGAWLLFGG